MRNSGRFPGVIMTAFGRYQRASAKRKEGHMKLTKPLLLGVCAIVLTPLYGCVHHDKEPVVIEKTQVVERPAPVIKEQTTIIRER